jgi:hypothetical protein
VGDLTFAERLRDEALRRPEIRGVVSELLRLRGAATRASLWPESSEPGVSPIGLYWRLWRIEDQAAGFEVLCHRCAPTGEVEQRKRSVRPARLTDFQYASSNEPVCVRCGWRSFDAHARWSEREGVGRG